MGMQQTTFDLNPLAAAVGAEEVMPTSIPVQDVTLEAKIDTAIAAIKAQVLDGAHLTVAWSGGKDSSVTLNLALAAYRELIAEGVAVPTLHVIHSDTLMEAPVVHAHNQVQIKRIEAFSNSSGIPIRVWVASPGLSNDYLVAIIGGRSVISVRNNTKCQQMTKAEPLGRLKRQVRNEIAAETGQKPKKVKIVTVIGTRFDESAQRKRAMEERGESATQAVEAMDDGQLVLSPVAEFTQMDIFEYIGLVRNEKIACYDSWADLVELYREMNGECMVLDFIAGKTQSRSACGARTGCWTCARTSSDSSAESLIAVEGDKYAWLKPLNDFRAYMIARHFDPSARTWLARSVDASGFISIEPNSYSPMYTEELLGIALSIQADEEIAAAELGIEPRFQILSLKQVMAIELSWARYGFQKAWTAMRMYLSVYRDGKRYPIPDVDSLPVFTEKDISFRSRVPFTDGEYEDIFNGLRNVEWAAADCEDLVIKGGEYVTNVQTGDEYDIDDEGLELFMAFDLEYAMTRVGINDAPSASIHYLLGLGTIQLYKGSHSDWTRMLRLSNQIHRHGLQPLLHDPHAIIAHLEAKRRALGLTNTPAEADATPVVEEAPAQPEQLLFW